MGGENSGCSEEVGRPEGSHPVLRQPELGTGTACGKFQMRTPGKRGQRPGQGFQALKPSFALCSLHSPKQIEFS